MVTPYQKERCIAYIREKRPEISYAKVCRVMGRSRTSKYYKKRMPEKDEKLREAITSILGTSRLGRKKVIVKVRKKYPGYGSSQIRRVYQKYGFSLYKRMKRKRFDNPANPIAVPLERNEEWAMDFMSDALARGSRFRTLNIVDQYNRKCLGIDARTSMPSRAVIHFLERMIEKHGKPKGIRTDNGPEVTSGLFQDWLDKNNIEWVKIQKGKPQQNAIIERFNKTYREDVLDANLFFSLQDVKDLTERWIEDYNYERPHEALDFKTPSEYEAA